MGSFSRSREGRGLYRHRHGDDAQLQGDHPPGGDLTLNRCIVDMTGGEGVVLGDQLDATDVTMNYCNITLENGTGLTFRAVR